MDSSSQIEGSSSTTSTRRALPSGRVSWARELDAGEAVVVMSSLWTAILRVPCVLPRNPLTRPVCPAVAPVPAAGVATARSGYAQRDHRSGRRIPCQEALSMTVRGGRFVLDDVSRAIIEQLQEDGRRPYARIATAVGLSEAAVRQRVQRLLDAGVMQVVAVTDPMQVGFSRQAMVSIRTSSDPREVADAVAAFPEVDYVVITAGSVDVLVEVVCEDDQ